jgi:hypothetical protein
MINARTNRIPHLLISTIATAINWNFHIFMTFMITFIKALNTNYRI